MNARAITLFNRKMITCRARIRRRDTNPFPLGGGENYEKEGWQEKVVRNFWLYRENFRAENRGSFQFQEKMQNLALHHGEWALYVQP